MARNQKNEKSLKYRKQSENRGFRPSRSPDGVMRASPLQIHSTEGSTVAYVCFWMRSVMEHIASCLILDVCL